MELHLFGTKKNINFLVDIEKTTVKNTPISVSLIT